MTTGRQCEALTRVVAHQCPHPARFRVVGNKHREDEPDRLPLEGEYVCGRHVRPALMDNGDVVWKPWIVTTLGPRGAHLMADSSERDFAGSINRLCRPEGSAQG